MEVKELRERIDNYIKRNQYVINCVRHNYLCDNWEPNFYFDNEMIEEGRKFLKSYSSVKIVTSKWALIYFAFMKELIEYNDKEYALKLTLFQAFLNFTFIMKKHFPVKFNLELFKEAIEKSKGKYLKQSVDYTLVKISQDSVDKLFNEYIKQYDLLKALIKMYYSKLRHKISQVIKVAAREYYKLDLLSGRDVKQGELSHEDIASMQIEKIIRFIRTYDENSIIELYATNDCKEDIKEFINLIREDEEKAEVQLRDILIFKKVNTHYSKCILKFTNNLMNM